MKLLIHDYAGHGFPISLSRQLAIRGHEVVHAFASKLQTPRGLLTRKPDDPERLQFRAVPMDPRYVQDKYSFSRRWTYERRYGITAASLVRELRPDFVLSGNTPTDSQGPIINASLDVGAAFVYWVQDFYSLAITDLLKKRRPLIGKAIGAWYRRLDRKHLRQSSRIVAITEDFNSQLEAWKVPRDRISVVPNWADLSSIPKQSKDNAWSQRFGLTEKFVFLYSGTLGMKHNPGLLIRLAESFRSNPRVIVVVNSEGLGASFLQREKVRLGLENLIVNGFQPVEEMPSVLGSADVCVTLLEHDASRFSVPSKILAYMCAGRAQLAAVPRNNRVWRTVTESQSGVLVEPSAPDSFVEAANNLFSDAEKRRRLGFAGRQFAEREFDIEKIASRFEAVFNFSRKDRGVSDGKKHENGNFAPARHPETKCIGNGTFSTDFSSVVCQDKSRPIQRT